MLLPAETVVKPPLELNQQATGRTEKGNLQRHPFRLEAGEFARLIVTRLSDAEFEIVPAAIKDVDATHYGPTPLFVTSKTAGEYAVEVRAGEVAGGYRLTLAERRPATAEDTIRLEAQAARARAMASNDPREAAGHLNRAIELWRKCSEEHGLLETLLNSADVSYTIDETKPGRALAEEAVALAVRLKDKYAESEARFLLAKFLGSGAAAQAISELEKSIELSTAVNDPNGLGKALNLSGSIYSTMKQHDRALQYYSRSLPIFRELGIRRYVASAQLSIGRSLNIMGREKESAKPFEEALEIYRSLGDKRNQAAILESMAETAAHADENDRAIALLQQVIALSRETRSDRMTASALTTLALVRGNTGNWPEARKLLNEALELQKKQGAAIETAQTRILLSRTETAHGSAERARVLASEALTDLERLAEQSGGIEAQVRYFAGFRAAYSAAVDAARKLGNEAEAFQASERSRARALGAMIASRKIDLASSIDPALRERSAKLGQSIALKLRQQTALERRTHTREEAEALARDIDELRHQQDRLQVEIRQAHPNYASITQYAPLDVDHLRQNVLDDDTVLVEFLVGLRRSYVWVVSREGVTGAQLPPAAVIDKLAREGYEALTARNRQQPAAEADAAWEKKAAELSKMLLEPVSAALQKKRWLVVSDETLHYVPFAALAPEHEIVNLPSAAVLKTIREITASRKPAPRTLAVFADPVFEKEDARLLRRATPTAVSGQRGQLELSRLPFTRREAEGILAGLPKQQVQMASDFAATRAAATDPALAGFRILHFATHGVLNEDTPELSGIVLSLFDAKGQPQDGFLRLHDIYNLKLPADLVVLSACQTALGKKMDGEGMIGLTRGMMFAGAARVVASLWKVDDAATAELMRLFYQAMLKDGKPAAEALHTAQRQLAAQRRWRSPYYWAAFQLHGEYR